MVKKWFKPVKTHSGWRKDMGIAKRRTRALTAHKGNALSTARSLQALANLTRDTTTKRAARKDALYFYAKHKRTK
jgi:hypothetical protein